MDCKVIIYLEWDIAGQASLWKGCCHVGHTMSGSVPHLCILETSSYWPQHGQPCSLGGDADVPGNVTKIYYGTQDPPGCYFIQQCRPTSQTKHKHGREEAAAGGAHTQGTATCVKFKARSY